MSAPFAPAALAPASVSARSDAFLPAIGYQPETPEPDQWQMSREINPLFAGVAAARFLPFDPAMWVALAEHCGMGPLWTRSYWPDGRVRDNGMFTQVNTDDPELEDFLNGWINTARKAGKTRVVAWLRRREMQRRRHSALIAALPPAPAPDLTPPIAAAMVTEVVRSRGYHGGSVNVCYQQHTAGNGWEITTWLWTGSRTDRVRGFGGTLELAVADLVAGLPSQPGPAAAERAA